MHVLPVVGFFRRVIEMKKCTNCGEVKPLEEFYKDKSKKDGRERRCKVCKKRYYEANREKISEQKKQYREDNREKILEYQKQYYETNRERVIERCKQYRQANSKKLLEWRRQYRQANREAFKLRDQKRRARKANAAGNCTPEQLQARFDYHGNRCVYCGSEEDLTIEHLIPLSKGGTNWPANLAPACKSCNSRKNSHKTFVEFKAEKSQPN